MKHALLSCALIALAGTAEAACYADYKAKKDTPLRLHYGVAQVSDCSAAGAAAELAPRLAAQGWVLLNVLGIFDENGLAERQQSAGQYFLRF